MKKFPKLRAVFSASFHNKRNGIRGRLSRDAGSVNIWNELHNRAWTAV